jgi:hypothetical protein
MRACECESHCLRRGEGGGKAEEDQGRCTDSRSYGSKFSQQSNRTGEEVRVWQCRVTSQGKDLWD